MEEEKCELPAVKGGARSRPGELGLLHKTCPRFNHVYQFFPQWRVSDCRVARWESAKLVSFFSIDVCHAPQCARYPWFGATPAVTYEHRHSHHAPIHCEACSTRRATILSAAGC